MIDNNLPGRMAVGGKLSDRFKGVAKDLAKLVDTSGRNSAHYAVSQQEPRGESFEPFTMCLLYETRSHRFVVVQTYPNRRFKNLFSVNEDGEVDTYCDHIPNDTFVGAILKGERIPTSLQPFDLELSTGPDAIDTVTNLAYMALRHLVDHGQLKNEINRGGWERGI